MVQVADTLALDAARSASADGDYRATERGPPLAVPGAHAMRALDAPAVQAIVEAAGRERFRARAARFEGDLAAVEADQVVWRGVCETVSLPVHVAAVRAAGRAVPWSQAALVVVDRGPVGLAGLLLGAAGLLAEATLPEAHAWRALQRSHRGRGSRLATASWDRRQVQHRGDRQAGRCHGLAKSPLAGQCRATVGGSRPSSSSKAVQQATVAAAAQPVAAGARLAVDRPRKSAGDRQ